MSQTEVSKKLAALKDDLRAEGRAVRRMLGGGALTDRLDSQVYVNRHMEKFGDITQEILFAQMWTRPGLDIKTRSMITVITDVTSGATAALGLHVRFCINHGWTEDEIVEAMIHCLGYIGVPLVRQAILVAVQVFDEMKAEAAATPAAAAI
jgi:alkylhydroperoxidase/carboxymuconolactone decarboxylase family protein YurZ